MDELNSIDAQEFADALKQVVGPASAQKRRAVVQQVGIDGTVWVQMPGSDKLVPITGSSAAVSPGDTVTTEFRGGALYVEGNASDPATGARHTDTAIRKAVKPIVADIAKAQEAADEAQAVADATNQHFFADESGVHVTEAEGDATTEHNILINSLGILLRKAVNHLVSITQSAIAFYDGLGNAASNIVAQFGADGAQIGKTGESHVELDYRSLQLVDKEGETYFRVSDLRGIDGLYELSETFTSRGDGAFWTTYKIVEVVSVTVNGAVTSASNYTTLYDYELLFTSSIPSPNDVVVIDYKTDSSSTKAFTFGTRDDNSFVGPLSYAEGFNVVSSGLLSHAEGEETEAIGRYSHAQNYGTVADFGYKTAIGVYNLRNVNSLFAIGNGNADDARSDAARVTWTGDLQIAGDVKNLSGTKLYAPADVGTRYAPTMGSSTNVATATWTQIHNFKLSAGKWLILAYVYCAQNGTGLREFVINTSTAAPSSATINGDTLVLPGSASASLYSCLPMFVAPSAETTYRLWAYQNSGSTLAMRGNLTAIRLG